MKSSYRQPVPLLIFALTGVALVAALWLTWNADPLRGDSAEYLYFDPSRTVGYPAFLALVRLLIGDVALAVPAQMILLAAALASLGVSVYRFTGRPIVSLLLQFLMVAMPVVWVAAARLMTEGLSTALVALWCGVLLRFIRDPTYRGSVMLVVIAALATTVRPSMVALFAATATVLLLVAPKAWRTGAIVAAASGLILAWVATPVAQLMVHGSAHTTSPVARGVLQHTLFCQPNSVPPDADSRFVEENAAATRDYIATLPPTLQEQFRKAYSSPLRFGLIIPVLGRWHALRVRSEADPYLSRIAWERLWANPTCYGRSVAREYLRMATFDATPTAEQAKAMRAVIKVHRPFDLPEFPLLSGDAQMAWGAAKALHNIPSGLNHSHIQFNVNQNIPFFVVLPVRLLYGGAALAGLLSLLAWFWCPLESPMLRRLLAPTITLGIALHAVLVITAIVEFSEERYLVPLWPIVCLTDGLAVLFVVACIRERRIASSIPHEAPNAVA